MDGYLRDLYRCTDRWSGTRPCSGHEDQQRSDRRNDGAVRWDPISSKVVPAFSRPMRAQRYSHVLLLTILAAAVGRRRGYSFLHLLPGSCLVMGRVLDTRTVMNGNYVEAQAFCVETPLQLMHLIATVVV